MKIIIFALQVVSQIGIAEYHDFGETNQEVIQEINSIQRENEVLLQEIERKKERLLSLKNPQRIDKEAKSLMGKKQAGENVIMVIPGKVENQNQNQNQDFWNENRITEAQQYFEVKTGLKVQEVQMRRTARELHFLTSKIDGIWLDVQSDLKQQIDKLDLVKDKIKLTENEFEHIDLRVPDQIFYKKKE